MIALPADLAQPALRVFDLQRAVAGGRVPGLADDGSEQLAVGGKALEQGAGGDLGLIGDLGEDGTVVTLLEERRPRRRQNLSPILFGGAGVMRACHADLTLWGL